MSETANHERVAPGVRIPPEVPIAEWEDSQRGELDDAFEWWYFDASFDDGSTAGAVFLTKALVHPTGKVSPSVEIDITDVDGVTHNVTMTVDANDMELSRDRCNVRMGASAVEGDLSTYRVTASSDDGRAVDLTFYAST